MIDVNDLNCLLKENNQKIFELEAENRVLNKLIVIEEAKVVEQKEKGSEEIAEEVVGELVQQDESY